MLSLLRGALAAAAQKHEWKVRPARLAAHPGGERLGRRRIERLVGDDRRGGGLQTRDKIADREADLAGQPDPLDHAADDLRVATAWRADENGPTRKVARAVHHPAHAAAPRTFRYSSAPPRGGRGNRSADRRRGPRPPRSRNRGRSSHDCPCASSPLRSLAEAYRRLRRTLAGGFR